MLCEFLWNEKEKKEKETSLENDGSKDKEQEQDSNQTKVKEEAESQSTVAVKQEAKDTEDDPAMSEKAADPSNKTDQMTYDEYRLNYAWTFLKHFFNQHLDDSWFRQQYSPALMVETSRVERRRCHAEANLLRRHVSNHGKNSQVLIRNTVLTVPSSSPNPAVPSNHLFSTHDRTLHVRNVPPHVTDEHIRQALLPYLMDYVVTQQAKDQNNKGGNHKGSKSSESNSKKQQPSQQEVLEQTLFGMFSSTPHNSNTEVSAQVPVGGTGGLSGSGDHHHHDNNQSTLSGRRLGGGASGGASNSTLRGGSVFLHRSVFCVCTSKEVLEGLWQVLLQRDKNTNSAGGTANPDGDKSNNNSAMGNSSNDSVSRRSGAGGDVHVPRKQDEASKNSSASGSQLDLEIDCTDPYGRTEYDANGRGGPPPDGLAVPPRKAVVAMVRYEQPVGGTLLLSSTLSSPIRFETDQEAATTIARALDVRQHVPVEDRLDTILEQFNNETNSNTETDKESNPSSLVLDIALAYLRRVHMYSFYKGVKATSFGDMLAGRSPASQMQLRDDVGMPETPESIKEDLLVQRLEDSIRQALEVDCHAWIANADWYVDEETDQAAREIADLEEEAAQEWLRNHVMDDDGRARCSFHFCHKLFKDESFLHKHLLKKHAAYNAAERAKCHDKFMMSVWESATTLRPSVPMILVDCGKQFGKKESAISGGAEPRATDPEPVLWERKELEEKLRQERQELRAARQQQLPQQPQQQSMGSYNSGNKGGPRPAFVDVDDMKDETLKVNFDQVQLPPVTKKKKKKRKLL